MCCIRASATRAQAASRLGWSRRCKPLYLPALARDSDCRSHIMTQVKRQPTQRQNSIVRAVNSLMPAVKLTAEDVMPDSLAAKAIGDMTKELETSVSTFCGWERQLGQCVDRCLSAHRVP